MESGKCVLLSESQVTLMLLIQGHFEDHWSGAPMAPVLQEKPLSQGHLVLALVVSYASKSSHPHTVSLPPTASGSFPLKITREAHEILSFL